MAASDSDIKAHPEAWCHFQAGIGAMRLRNFDKALEQFQEANRLYECRLTHCALAFAFYNLGKLARANHHAGFVVGPAGDGLEWNCQN